MSTDLTADNINGNEREKETVDDDNGLNIPEELLQALPEEERKEITKMFSFRGSFPQQNPILKKITSEHISAVLKNSDEEDKRDRVERKEERNHNYKIMVTALFFILLVGWLLLYFKQIEMMKYLAGSVFGFAGGFGVGKYYKNKEED